MGFEYYYGSQADQFNFIRIPKALITDEIFDTLSVNAKMLYGVLLDRMNLSMKNGWIDGDNRVYIHYQISDIMEDLKMARATAVKYMNELEEFGLVEKKRQGLGRANIIYVKSFLVKDNYDEYDRETAAKNNETKEVEMEEKGAQTPVNTQKFKNYTSRSSKNEIQEVQNLNFKEFNNYTSGSSEIEIQEVQELNPNNTNKSNNNINNTKKNNTNYNNISSNLISRDESALDTNAQVMEQNQIRCDEKKQTKVNEYNAYKNYIKESIEYDILIERYPLDADMINEIVELMTETIISKGDTVVIASNEFPKEVVKSRFMKIGFQHIEYVLDCLKKNTTKVKNIKKYILAAIYNAPLTMSSYYSAEVNHDYPGYASGASKEISYTGGYGKGYRI